MTRAWWSRWWVMGRQKAMLKKQSGDIDHLNHQAMKWFVESVDCLQVTLGHLMDKVRILSMSRWRASCRTRGDPWSAALAKPAREFRSPYPRHFGHSFVRDLVLTNLQKRSSKRRPTRGNLLPLNCRGGVMQTAGAEFMMQMFSTPS
jgi:hypothetical protein